MCGSAYDLLIACIDSPAQALQHSQALSYIAFDQQIFVLPQPFGVGQFESIDHVKECYMNSKQHLQQVHACNRQLPML